MYFKFTRLNGVFYMLFASFQDAENFAGLLEPMTIEQMPSEPVFDVASKLESDKSFCDYLTDRFVKENRDAGITEPESITLLTQFKDILSMAQVGSVPSVYSLLQNVTVGTIYTQERKTRDLADLESYINNV